MYGLSSRDISKREVELIIIATRPWAIVRFSVLAIVVTTYLAGCKKEQAASPNPEQTRPTVPASRQPIRPAATGPHSPAAAVAPPTPTELVAALQKAEDAHDPEAQSRAVAALRAAGPGALPQLADLLDSSNIAIRAEAVELMTAVGPAAAPAAIKGLGTAGQDKDSAAADVLANLGDASTLPLMDALRDPSMPRRCVTMWAVAVKRPLAQRGQVMLPLLFQSMKAPDEMERLMATQAVVGIGLATGNVQTRALRSAYDNDPSKRVKSMALRGLGAVYSNPDDDPRRRTGPKLPSGAAAAAAEERKIVDGLSAGQWFAKLQTAKQARNDSEKRRVMEALEKLGADGVDLYAQHTTRDGGYLADESLALLVKAGAASVPALTRILLNGPAPKIQNALADIGQPGADGLAELLEQSSENTRASAMAAFLHNDRLAAMGAPAVAHLKALYPFDPPGRKTFDLRVIAKIAQASGHSEDDFIKEAAKDPNPEVQQTAAELLSQTHQTSGGATAGQARGTAG